MSKLILIVSCLFLGAAASEESIYNFSVTAIEGHYKSLDVYKGKKLLIITLPAQQNSSNDSFLNALDSIRTMYDGSLSIIAVPSLENGYMPAKKNELKQWYKSKLNSGIMVTEGVYTRKTSGSNQHPLFRWLTNADKNGHFNVDADAAGQFFVVSKSGALYSVLSGQVPASTLKQVLEQMVE
jgi:glutathione peroxidase